MVPFLLVIGCAETEAKGCVQFTPKANERFIHVEVEDETGTPVYAYVNQDTNGDGRSDIDGAICGRTESPLRVVPEVPVNVFVLAGQSSVLPERSCLSGDDRNDLW